MTNYEHFKKDIEPYSICATNWGFADGKVQHCEDLTCAKCVFNNGKAYIGSGCHERQFAWLTEEYKEPDVDWNKVPVDAKILVSSDGLDWQRRYFASYDGKRVAAFSAGLTSWSSGWASLTSWPYAKLAEEK